LPHGPISAAGKTVAVLAGFFWGLSRSLRRGRPAVHLPASSAGVDELADRLARVEAAVSRLTAGREEVYVTGRQLSDALALSEGRIQERVAAQFDGQMLAIRSLRSMILDTDAMLERLLSRLEREGTEELQAPASDVDPEDAQEAILAPGRKLNTSTG
jgi:hypothetical protein